MRLFLALSTTVVLVAFAGLTAARRPAIYPPIRPIRYGEIHAETMAGAVGYLSQAQGNSNVQVNNGATLGMVNHAALGMGTGQTGAASAGRIDSFNGYQASSVDTAASAAAFGNLGSYSETGGEAVIYNGLGQAGASSAAGAAGIGASVAETGAHASTIRQKRQARRCGSHESSEENPQPDCVDPEPPQPNPYPLPYPYPGFIDAQTNAGAVGDLAQAQGNSNVQVSNGATLGMVNHAALGVGTGQTGAASAGRIDSFNGYQASSVDTAASAAAFGNLGSYSETGGEAVIYNGLGQAGASSAAGAAGIGASVAETGAHASTIRQKRRARRCGSHESSEENPQPDCVDPEPPQPNPYPLPYPYPGFIDAQTNAGAVGDLAQAQGNSNVQVSNGATLGMVNHAALGVGTGQTGAASAGRIDSFNGYQASSVDTAASAAAFGNLGSYSETGGEAVIYNGLGQAGASSAAGAAGIGASVAETGAHASTIRQKRRARRCGSHESSEENPQPDCVDPEPPQPNPYPLPYPYPGFIDAQTNAGAVGDLAQAQGNSNVQVSNGATLGMVNHAALGVGTGQTGAASAGRIDSFNGYQASSVDTAASAAAFGNLGSYSETGGEAVIYNGLGQAGASSAAGATGIGASAAETGAHASTIRQKRRARRGSGSHEKSGSHERSKSYERSEEKPDCVEPEPPQPDPTYPYTPQPDPYYPGEPQPEPYPLPSPYPGSIGAQTNAGAVGDLTSAIGASNVGVDPYGTQGSVFHGAEGVGQGATGARSNGAIVTSNGFAVNAVGSAAEADAFGNLGSYSGTEGEAHMVNEFGMASAGSKAESLGTGAAAARTGAAAFNY